MARLENLVINFMWHMREKEDSMICVPLNNSEDGGNIIEKVNTGDW